MTTEALARSSTFFTYNAMSTGLLQFAHVSVGSHRYTYTMAQEKVGLFNYQPQTHSGSSIGHPKIPHTLIYVKNECRIAFWGTCSESESDKQRDPVLETECWL